MKQKNDSAISFEPYNEEINIQGDDLAFAYAGSSLLVMNNKIPNYKQILQLNIETALHRYIGRIGNKACHIMHIMQNESDLPEHLLLNIRPLIATLDEVHLKAAMYGFQIKDWDKKSQFCGQCGNKTKNSPKQLLKICTECKAEFYPRISPAVIVSIVKDDKLLLADHSRFKEQFFTVLAGFVSPGETLEECVKREIKEEANIEVKNIKYFGSQPWPFPDSLMVGFTAEYHAGTLKPDKDEIEELKWFERHEIEEWPIKYSISWQLIENFINSKPHKDEKE